MKLPDRASLWEDYATLFSFPDAGYTSCAARLAGDTALCKRARRSLSNFENWLSNSSRETIEESFTQIFDLSPVSSPIAGIHLYGQESYKRGALMAGLVERYLELGIKLSGELPDHVSFLFQYVSRAEDEEKREIDSYLLRQTLNRMIKSLREKQSPFEHLVAAAIAELEVCFGKEVVHA